MEKPEVEIEVRFQLIAQNSARRPVIPRSVVSLRQAGYEEYLSCPIYG